jgi:cation-transporting ATPase 13A1
VLAGCHTLLNVESKSVGDPLEVAALESIQWNFGKSDVAMSRSGPKKVVRIIHRHHFQSALQRMCTIVSLDHLPQPEIRVLAKGAPEKLKEFYDPATVPHFYDEAYQYFSRQGYRVLALAWKRIATMTVDKLKAIPRPDLEHNLTFAGFVVFECPLKPDSSSVIQKLTRSSHDVNYILLFSLFFFGS